MSGRGNIRRGEGGEEWWSKKDTGYLYKAFMVARRPLKDGNPKEGACMSGRGRFDFALAEEADDGELRDLLRHISMPGNITLSFLREPSFFLAEQAGSITSQVIVCKDRQKGQIVGMGNRSIRCVYIDGKPARVGYRSEERRVGKECRSRWSPYH